MENFKVSNPTTVFFGKNVVDGLGIEVKETGTNVLLMYGKGSIKHNGIYDQVMFQLKSAGAIVTEYSGIKPNPLVDDVNFAAAVGRENKINCIVAVGGGSVIDSAKITALCIHEAFDAWAVMKGKVKPKTSVPVIAILTLAATGTEMNPYAVLQNTVVKEKIGYGCNLMYPKISYLDPQYTFSVPADQTAYGIVDLISHTLEAYFGSGQADLSDKFATAVIKEAVEIAPLVLSEPHNYKYRARMMWAATCALNGTTSHGRSSGDWGVHGIGHILSLLYDLPHGATLSIAYPAWMKLLKEKLAERISLLGNSVFNVQTADETINCFEGFFQSIKSPVRLKEVSITADRKEEIVQLMNKNKVSGFVHKLLPADYEHIVEFMI